MASQQSQEMSHKGGEMAGQAQIKKDEYAEKISHSLDKLSDNSQSDQNSITFQASNFIQQTGEQVRNMAQGATEAVKNTLGMNSSEEISNSNNSSNSSSSNNNNNNPTNMKNPNSTTTPSMPGHPPSSS